MPAIKGAGSFGPPVTARRPPRTVNESVNDRAADGGMTVRLTSATQFVPARKYSSNGDGQFSGGVYRAAATVG